MLFGITHVINMNFIEPILVELVEMGAALRILKWDVIGDEGDVVLSAGLITPEHVQVGAVNLGLIAYERSFPVAGCIRGNCTNKR